MDKMTVEEIKSAREIAFMGQKIQVVDLCDTALALYEELGREVALSESLNDIAIGVKAENERLLRYERAWEEARNTEEKPEQCGGAYERQGGGYQKIDWYGLEKVHGISPEEET